MYVFQIRLASSSSWLSNVSTILWLNCYLKFIFFFFFFFFYKIYNNFSDIVEPMNLPLHCSTTLEQLARSSPGGGFFPPSSPSVGLFSPSLGYYNKPTCSASSPVLNKGEPFVKNSWQSLYPSDLSHSLLSPRHKRMKVRLKELHHY